MGCQRTVNAAEINKDICPGPWGGVEVNGSEAEHKITKLEITSVKTGLCDSCLVSTTGKVMSSDIFWLG